MNLAEELRTVALELEVQANAGAVGQARREQLLHFSRVADKAAEFVEAMDPRGKFDSIATATPLVLYFPTPADADAFSALVQAACPNLKARTLE